MKPFLDESSEQIQESIRTHMDIRTDLLLIL